MKKLNFSKGLIIGMVIGIAVGMTLGHVTKNEGMFISICVALGVAIGAAYDKKQAEKRYNDYMEKKKEIEEQEKNEQ